jgi:hypothetical protein
MTAYAACDPLPQEDGRLPDDARPSHSSSSRSLQQIRRGPDPITEQSQQKGKTANDNGDHNKFRRSLETTEPPRITVS